MIDQILRNLLSPKGKGGAKVTRDSLILGALAYLLTVQMPNLEKRLAVMESRIGLTAGQGTNHFTYYRAPLDLIRQ
jgi:hypothetical protein